MPADILRRIVARRQERLAAEGPAQGLDLPEERPAELPVVPFPQPLICEIKRRSPSRGELAAGVDPVERAGAYRDAGARAVSVLTEQDHFSGALADLVAVKRAWPDLAVLRKDFLLSPADVAVAWRAGADAVLLIAAILERATMEAMLAAAAEYGLSALVEIHDREDLEKVRPLRPAVVGINSRDLRSFRVDLLGPLALAAAIDWECALVFESGIFHREDVLLARDGGFAAALVGEAVVRDPGRVRLLAQAMEQGPGATGRPDGAPEVGGANGAARAHGVGPAGDTPPGERAAPFWPLLAARREAAPPARPLVKVCGITGLEDARMAVRLGADLLGLVYAPSVRRAPQGLARELVQAGIAVPLVAVVVEPGDDGHVERAMADREAGWISALQLHGGAERPLAWGWPVFQALRPASAEQARELVAHAPGPRVLLDARHPHLAGGTGVPVDEEVLAAVQEALAARPHGALWLAGGLGPDGIGEVIARHRPELIDASSRLEAEPGRKDHELLRRFFTEIDAAAARLAAEEGT